MKPVPFMQSALELADLCRELESSDDVSSALLARFSEAEAHLSSSIDRRKAFLDEIKSKKELGKARKKQIDGALSTLTRIEEELKCITMLAMRNHPDQPFKDTMGKKLTISRAKPKLTLDIGAPLSLTHTLDSATCDTIDPKYLNVSVVWKINKEAVLQALLAGEELPWARLETTEYVRGL